MLVCSAHGHCSPHTAANLIGLECVRKQRSIGRRSAYNQPTTWLYSSRIQKTFNLETSPSTEVLSVSLVSSVPAIPIGVQFPGQRRASRYAVDIDTAAFVAFRTCR